MKLRSLLAAGVVLAATGLIAYAEGYFPGWPIVGNPAYCGGQNTAGIPGTAAQCTNTVPAGPPNMTGNELVPADTELAGGQAPQTVLVPSGIFLANGGASNNSNALVGSDFGQALWQRGTTPLNAAVIPAAGSPLMGPDGWYVTQTAAAGSTVTVSKQTAAADQPPNSLASARVQRPNAQTAVIPICIGQLVPDVDSQVFLGKTAIFSFDAMAGSNFSPSASNVNVTIAYHSAADVTTPAANGQGTNTATFASSVGATQNITNYTEAIVQSVIIGTTWARYSVAAPIPLTIPATMTAVGGVGVKICFTPVGTAGANDWFEFGKAKLEARFGTSVGPSPYIHNSLVNEYALELARYEAILENGNSATPIYANGMGTTTGGINFMLKFAQYKRITPVTSPLTVGGFKANVAGTATTIASFTTTGMQNTQQTAGINAQGTGITAGQATELIGTGVGTGVIGFSAEP